MKIISQIFSLFFLMAFSSIDTFGKAFMSGFAFGVVADDGGAPAESDTEAGLMEKLKNVVPKLEDIKAFKGKTTEELAELKEEIGNLNGTILELGKKQVELAKQKIIMNGTGISKAEKVSFAHYLADVVNQKENPSLERTERIKQYQMDHCSKTALNEATDAQGGYLVPEMFRDQIWRIVGESSIVARDALQVPLTSGYKLPTIALNANVSVAFVSEGGAVPQSEPTFSKTTVSALKLMAYSVMSSEVQEDEEVGLVDLLITLFGEQIAENIDSEGFNGDGTNFTGVLNASGVNSVTMTAGLGFGGLTLDNMTDALESLKAGVRAGARWYLHRTILNVVKKLKDSNNNYIWGAPTASESGTIWGIPYTLSEQMPALSDTAALTPFIFVGNMKNYQYGTKGGMTVRVSDIPKILTDQTIIVIRERFALGMALPAAFSVIKTGAAS